MQVIVLFTGDLLQNGGRNMHELCREVPQVKFLIEVCSYTWVLPNFGGK